jgi:D-arabinose 1-dehydrogenase-like Zn-dependent alcohol dehydrogenase
MELPALSAVPLIMGGRSIHGWPSGHAKNSEDAVEFAQIQDVNCMIEKFPLAKAQEALDSMLANKVRFRGVLVME